MQTRMCSFWRFSVSICVWYTLPPVMSFRKSMNVKMYHHIDVKKQQTNKNKIYYPNAVCTAKAWCVGGSKRDKKNSYSSAVFAHILRLNHVGASTLFVIYSESIEHEMIEWSIITKKPQLNPIWSICILYDCLGKQVNMDDMHLFCEYTHGERRVENICIHTYASSASPSHRMS